MIDDLIVYEDNQCTKLSIREYLSRLPEVEQKDLSFGIDDPITVQQVREILRLAPGISLLGVGIPFDELVETA